MDSYRNCDAFYAVVFDHPTPLADQETLAMAYSIDLSGRVALVTGASSGLGSQFARTLARDGAGVVLASRRVDKLKDLRARIEDEGGDAGFETGG